MRSSVAVASEVGARAIPRAPVRVTPRIRPLRRLDPGRKRSHREGQVGAALALVVVLGALVVPAAEAGVRWDGARFERQEELCVWLRAHRSRCAVWAIPHPTAWVPFVPPLLCGPSTARLGGSRWPEQRIRRLARRSRPWGGFPVRFAPV